MKAITHRTPRECGPFWYDKFICRKSLPTQPDINAILLSRLGLRCIELIEERGLEVLPEFKKEILEAQKYFNKEKA